MNALAQLRLVVWQKNGEKVYFDLAEEPRTTFEKGLLVITTSRMRTEYQLSNILRYTHDGAATEISVPQSAGMGFTQKGDDIEIRCITANKVVQLYNPKGILLETRKTDGKNAINFSLKNLPAGTYIVKVDDQTLKFMKI